MSHSRRRSAGTGSKKSPPDPSIPLPVATSAFNFAGVYDSLDVARPLLIEVTPSVISTVNFADFARIYEVSFHPLNDRDERSTSFVIPGLALPSDFAKYAAIGMAFSAIHGPSCLDDVVQRGADDNEDSKLLALQTCQNSLDKLTPEQRKWILTKLQSNVG